MTIRHVFNAVNEPVTHSRGHAVFKRRDSWSGCAGHGIEYIPADN
ncbi:MAG: hypothetical protein ACFFD4_08925 [Candidatus Odinarchaeota archaeon]